MMRLVRREGEALWHWVIDCPEFPDEGPVVELGTASAPPEESLCDWCLTRAEEVIEGPVAEE